MDIRAIRRFLEGFDRQRRLDARPRREDCGAPSESRIGTNMLGGISARRRGLVLVLTANILWSSAGLFARLVDHLDVWTILCGRAFFGGLFIVVAAFFEWRRGALGPNFGLGRLAPLLVALSAIAVSSLQRRHPGMSMTAINGLGAFAAAFAFSLSPHPAMTLFDLAVLAVFGLATVCVAFILIMEGAKHIPSAEIGLISMLDVVLGPLWVFLFFGERPGPLAFAGGALVLGALIWRLAPEIGRDRAGAVVG